MFTLVFEHDDYHGVDDLKEDFEAAVYECWILCNRYPDVIMKFRHWDDDVSADFTAEEYKRVPNGNIHYTQYGEWQAEDTWSIIECLEDVPEHFRARLIEDGHFSAPELKGVAMFNKIANSQK